MKDEPKQAQGGGERLSSETILGITFHTGTSGEAIEAALFGALVLAPSGPGLAGDLVESETYREALQGAEINLTDSGFLLLLWRAKTGRKLPRLSGLGYLQALLKHSSTKSEGGTFWVMPNASELTKNVSWLQQQGLNITAENCYLAPHYGAGQIKDLALLESIRRKQPKLVIIAIGGGVQERLGWWLSGAFKPREGRPGVVCIGAAIAFLSGAQNNIPSWADRWMLGWLFRVLASPGRYVPRYWRALRLAGLVIRHGANLPPLLPGKP